MMINRKAAVVAVAVAALHVLLVRGVGAATTQDELSVTAIHVAEDSHIIVATATRLHCTSQCAVLLLSHDGGATWTRPTGRGWPGGEVFPATVATTSALLTAGTSGIWMSTNGGDSFTSLSPLDGGIDVVSAHGKAYVLVSPASDHGALLIVLPDRTVTALSGPVGSYSGATLWLNAAYPDVDSTTPAALAAVISEQNTVSVQLCDRSFTCHATGAFPQGSGVAGVAFSPHYVHDHTLFALTAKGVVETRDGGTTFAPVAIASQSNGAIVNTAVGLATTRDFDAINGSGGVLAAVDSVATTARSTNASSSVYRSADGLNWESLAGSTTSNAVLTAFALTSDRRALAGRIDFSSHASGLVCSADWVNWRSACPAAAVLAGKGAGGETNPAGGGPATGASTPLDAIRTPAVVNANLAAAAPQTLGEGQPGVTTSTAGALAPAGALLCVALLATSITHRRRKRGNHGGSHHTDDCGT